MSASFLDPRKGFFVPESQSSISSNYTAHHGPMKMIKDLGNMKKGKFGKLLLVKRRLGEWGRGI